jgi:hypothetical protein
MIEDAGEKSHISGDGGARFMWMSAPGERAAACESVWLVL